MELTIGRYEPQTGSAGGVRNPARDTLSGGLVTVLRSPAPADPGDLSRELDRLRRYARTRHLHLAEVRAVEPHGDEVHVVCEPLTGVVLAEAGRPPGPGLTVAAVRAVATGLLDALSALHRAGVVHGAVRADAVLVASGPAEPVVTLLPLPVDGSAPTPAGTPEDDTRAAATLLLRLLRRVRVAGPEDQALARTLAATLERAGGTDDEGWGPPGAGLSPPTAPVAVSARPVPLALHPASLAPVPARPGVPAARVVPARRSRVAAAADRERPTAPHRLVLSVLSLGALLVGVVGVLAGAEGVRIAGLLVFALVGVGSAPWQLRPGVQLGERLVLTGITSFGVLTLPSVLMVVRQSWDPVPVAIGVAVLCVPPHVLGGRRALATIRATRPAARWTPRTVPPSLVAAVVGALVCLAAALTHRHGTPGFWGFLATIGPAWYVGLALVLVGIVTARAAREWLVAVPVVLLTEVLTLTPSLVYDGPRSQSMLKHVELAQMVRAGGGLHSAIDAYNAWPGFFSSMAWLCDVLGVQDPVHLALFWPPLLALLRVTALRYLFGQLLGSTWSRWVAVTLAVLADAIGADYFSPQSVGFVLGLCAFGVALSRSPLGLRSGMVLLAGATIATSHQLSPFAVGGALVVLVLFRQVTPWWLPLCVVVPAELWTLVHLNAVSGFLGTDLAGKLTNFTPPQTVATPGLAREAVVGASSYALLAGILLLGVLALVTLVRQRRTARAWGLALSPLVGLTLVAVNPYGQEGIFRAALFGLPWLAALAAQVFPEPRRWQGRVPVGVVVTALTATFLVASFALDAFTITRPADVAAVRWPQQHGADAHVTVLLGEGDLPDTVRAGQVVTSPSRLELAAGEKSSTVALLPPAMEVDRIDALVWDQYSRDSSGTPVFALWSPVQSAYQQAYGLMTPARFAELRDDVAASPYWHQVFTDDGTVLFEFDRAAYAATRR